MRHSVALTVLAMTSLVPLAGAQTSQQKGYAVSHSFNFQPAADVVEVKAYTFRHVWVRSTLGVGWDVEPSTQAAGFKVYGEDRLRSPGCINLGPGGASVNCIWNVATVPASGLIGSRCLTLPVGQSSAEACTDIDVAPFSLTPPINIQGTIGASGHVFAGTGGIGAARAYAFSATAITVKGGTRLANGRIHWTFQQLSDSVGDGTAASALYDPIHLIATNTNDGTVVDAMLLSIECQAGGQGVAQWDGAGLTVDAPDFTLVIDIPAAYVAPGQEGRVELRVEGGIVTVANDAGRYAGVLPAPGTGTPFTVPIPVSVDLDYDLGLGAADPWDVEAILSGGGDGMPEAIGCPQDIDGNGVLNLDDINGFANAFIAGDVELADLDGNGVLNLDDINAFATGFLGGCPSVPDEG